MTTGSPDAFSELGTLGVEEEFFLVGADGRPTAGSDTLVYEADPPARLTDRIDHELFKFVIETQTPKLGGPSEAGDAIRETRDALVSYAAEHGYGVAAAGLHPGARWREHEHAEKPRYRSQLERIQYPQHRNTTAGLHIHVGVDDADKAMWVANEIRWYLPVLLALSANSPYWNGHDTGLASARAKVFENLPNTGMPTTFDSYAEFDAFEERMVEHGSMADRGEIWWDVRPHSGHGTVEVRAPDAQHDPAVVEALVRYVHALVIDLAERYADGESGYAHRRELLDENKWRATRHGHDASFIARDGDGTVTLGEVVDRECERLDVAGLRDVYETESGADFQRRVRDTEGANALYDAVRL
ncbi:glutamate--cysteine ligase archaeal [Halarchaeum acidiphilum MH1-52-1]|uniref:Glutamate--cysteine ligase n=1 Tax=Halarchaeum acidiphilum MH1-52-1 TaxID=1261545 RepID=U3A7Y4_9EURY|nr:glutamate--cysteine ligase [Halarchaeum acidiphilum]GAD53789.1 glutamate--cysteine ligase archaeal [Halarchaeum acidiphilum MH1-52-1]